jgi:hypothetical protein
MLALACFNRPALDFAFCYFERESEMSADPKALTDRDMDRKLATKLVQSIRKFHPTARVTQLTNLRTPLVSADIESLRLELPEDYPMLARMILYAGYQHSDAPTIFVDADMVLAKPFRVNIQALTSKTVVLCERFFVRGQIVHLKVPRLALTFDEYNGLNIEDIMPFLGCFAITTSNLFWLQCLCEMSTMEPRSQAWNGDQLAMKSVFDRKTFDVRVLSEQRVAVPFKIYDTDPNYRVAPFVHFKGNSKYSPKARSVLP